MKAQKCRLILHGSYKEHDMGEFPSMASARKYVRECWNRPYTIKPLEEKPAKTKTPHPVFGGEAYAYSKGKTVIGFVYRVDGDDKWNVWGGLGIPSKNLNKWLDEEVEAKHTSEGWGGSEKSFNAAERLLVENTKKT